MNAKFEVGQVVVHKSTHCQLMVLAVDEFSFGGEKEYRYTIRAPDYKMISDVRQFELDIIPDCKCDTLRIKD